jgi:hypothetical protein
VASKRRGAVRQRALSERSRLCASRRDLSADLAHSRRTVTRADDDANELARLAPAGLILLALTSAFAVIDAVMSLDPTFASSLFGLGFISEIGALALSAATLALICSSSPDPEALRQLARLLLAFVILWAIWRSCNSSSIWQSDLPHEVAWYLPRWRQGWASSPGLSSLRISLRRSSHCFRPERNIRQRPWDCRGVSHRRRHSSSVLAGRSGGANRSFRVIALLTLSALLAMACTSALASRLTRRIWVEA